MVNSKDFKEMLIKYLDLEELSAEDIDDKDPLFGDEDSGLGLDSVDSIELVLAIEKEYGVKVSDPKQYDTIFASVESLLIYINDNQK